MNGTWKTTSGGSDALVPLAVIVGSVVLIGSGALTAAVAAFTDLLMIVLICAVAAVVIVCVAAFLLWRRYGHRTAPALVQYAAFHAAREAERVAASRPAREITPPVQQFHVHFHGDQQPDPAQVLRQALTEGDQR